MKLFDIITYTEGTAINTLTSSNTVEHINKICTDTREIENGDLFVPLIGDRFDAHDFVPIAFEKGVSASLWHKDKVIPYQLSDKTLILVENTVVAYQNIAKGIRQKLKGKVPLVAITGSVGKTTTKDMLFSIFSTKYNTLRTEGNLNNHIGVPKTILKYSNEEIIVLEMGMNHIGEISVLSNIAKPDVAILTNIGDTHIGNLGSRENILKAKLEILEGMSNEGVVIINNDDALLRTVKDNIKQKIITYGIKNKSDFVAYDIEISNDKTNFKIKEDNKEYIFEIPLPGEHLVYNTLAGIAAGTLYNLSCEDVINGVKDFKLSKLRMDIKTNDRGLTIINDTYNASPDSMKAVIDTVVKMNGKRKILILADMLELGEFSGKIHFELGQFIGKKDLDHLITVGNEAKEIAKGALSEGMTCANIASFENNESAYDFISNLLQEGDVILIKGSRGMKMDQLVERLL